MTKAAKPAKNPRTAKRYFKTSAAAETKARKVSAQLAAKGYRVFPLKTGRHAGSWYLTVIDAENHILGAELRFSDHPGNIGGSLVTWDGKDTRRNDVATLKQALAVIKRQGVKPKSGKKNPAAKPARKPGEMKTAKKVAAKKAAAKRAKNLHPALLAAGGAVLSTAAAKAAKWAMKPFSSVAGAKSAKPAKKKSKKRATKKHSPPVGGRAAKLKKAVTLKAKTARPPARTGPPAVVAEVASALRGLGYSAGKARSMALLGQEATGSKHFDAVLHSAMKGAKKNPKPKAKKKSTKKKPNGHGKLKQSAAMYERFHGAPSTEVIEVIEAEGISAAEAKKIAGQTPPDDYAGMGPLVSLDVCPPGSDPSNIRYSEGLGYLQAGDAYTVAFTGKQRPRTCCDPAGKQIYFIGGDQDLTGTPLLKKGRELGFDLVDLGECTMIVYETRKHFDNFELVDYFHRFGEETEERPHLVYSPARHRLYLVGGAYWVTDEGIRN